MFNEGCELLYDKHRSCVESRWTNEYSNKCRAPVGQIEKMNDGDDVVSANVNAAAAMMMVMVVL